MNRQRIENEQNMAQFLGLNFQEIEEGITRRDYSNVRYVLKKGRKIDCIR